MHTEFLLDALEQARLGRGLCAPNPAVGAIAVKDGQVIAKAWHHGAGMPHAEQLLLENLVPGMEGVTLYVTLEPCNHWGRTPPCVSSIVEYGIKKVVFAYPDPNPVVKANDTPASLQQHGIEVLHYPIEEINQFYNSYTYWINTGSPWVSAKIAQSLDGKIAGPNKNKVQLSNQLCDNFTHKKRLFCDVILTTAQTVRQDNPLLNVRLDHTPQSKLVAILDRQLSLDLDEVVFQADTSRIIFYDSQLSAPETTDLLEYIPIEARNDRLNLEQVIKSLGEKGFHDVWVEAGAELFTGLHQKGLVNQTYIYITPHVLGPDAYTGYNDSLNLSQAQSMNWHSFENNVVLSLVWNDQPVEEVCLQD